MLYGHYAVVWKQQINKRGKKHTLQKYQNVHINIFTKPLSILYIRKRNEIRQSITKFFGCYNVYIMAQNILLILTQSIKIYTKVIMEGWIFLQK